jgi:hypothetical protein
VPLCWTTKLPLLSLAGYRHALDGDIAGRAFGGRHRGQHFADAGAFQLAMVALVDGHAAGGHAVAHLGLALRRDGHIERSCNMFLAHDRHPCD